MLGEHVPLEVSWVRGLVAAHVADTVQDLVVDGLLVVLDETGSARPVVAARVVTGKVLYIVVLRLDVVLQVVPPRRPASSVGSSLTRFQRLRTASSERPGRRAAILRQRMPYVSTETRMI